MRYESLKYGVENAARGLEIRDPATGELLGGKKAAIQYYYSIKYGDKAQWTEGMGEEDVNLGRTSKL